MIQICSYCKATYGEKEPLSDRRETHGICAACLPGVLENLKQETKKYWLLNLDERKLEKIKKGILATLQISPSLKVFLSVIMPIDSEEEAYILGFMDLSAGRIFDLKCYPDPNEAATAFADLVWMCKGFKDEICA